jgi:phosphoribosylformylglycinamidine cyclo-ligase
VTSPTPLSYRDAGVDIDAGDSLVERIKPHAKRTLRPEVLAGIGGFGALMELPRNYKEPVLISGTDGVGTKLKLAFQMNKHDTIGQDLVAMSVNDILVQGAEPLFFLDYFACGHLDVDVAEQVIAGHRQGLRAVRLRPDRRRDRRDARHVSGRRIRPGRLRRGRGGKIEGHHRPRHPPGDAVLGLASSGPHSNGYSLVRKIVEVSGADLSAPFDGRTLGETLLEPTRIYVKPLLALMKEMHGSRAWPTSPAAASPATCRACCRTTVLRRHRRRSWTWPPPSSGCRQQGNVDLAEMHRTFNCGIGMVLVVDAGRCRSRHELPAPTKGETVYLLGEIRAREAGQEQTIIV